MKPFDMTAFNWYIGGEEPYFVNDGALGETIFPSEVNEMDGVILKGILEKKEYYVIFANLKAYPKEKNVIDVQT